MLKRSRNDLGIYNTLRWLHLLRVAMVMTILFMVFGSIFAIYRGADPLAYVMILLAILVSYGLRDVTQRENQLARSGLSRPGGNRG